MLEESFTGLEAQEMFVGAARKLLLLRTTAGPLLFLRMNRNTLTRQSSCCFYPLDPQEKGSAITQQKEMMALLLWRVRSER
jgi:hypothetical protein